MAGPLEILDTADKVVAVARLANYARRWWKIRCLRQVWGFRDGDPVVVVCSELDDPQNRQFVEPREFIYCLKYGDLDAYVEVLLTLARLFPKTRARVISAGELNTTRIDLGAHLVVIGGPDYNPMAERVLSWDKTQFEYRSVDMPEKSQQYPDEIVLHDKIEDKEYCHTDNDHDYGYFERFPNPNKPKRQVVVIGGCHTVGVTGSAKAFSAMWGEESDMTTVLDNAALVAKMVKKFRRFAVLVNVERVGQTVSVPVVKAEDVAGRL